MIETASIDNKVRQIIANIRNLPTPPIVFHQIQKVMNDPYVSAGQIASILSEDPAMSVKVLKLTNSAFYGLSREVDSVKQAVVIVGLEAIKNLVLSASVLEMFKGQDIDREFQEEFWRHSLATGFCGRILAKALTGKGRIDPDSAFSAGLLHDIGKMIFSCFLPDERDSLKTARSTDPTSSDYDLENQVLGYNHAQLGGFLGVKWKIPLRLIEAISFHHDPGNCATDDPTPYFVNIANYLAKKTFYDPEEGNVIPSLDQTVAEHMGFEPEMEGELIEQLREEYSKAETFMQMAGLG